MHRKNNPQITQIAQIKLKADRCVKKYNLREFAKSADVFKVRKNNPQITQIAQIKLKADRGVKKYNLRESAKSADCFELAP